MTNNPTTAMSLFLTNEQLQDLTGYKNHSAQRTWLVDNGYSFDIRCDGRPNVLIQQLMERQCKNVESKPGPDLAWMEETG